MLKRLDAAAIKAMSTSTWSLAELDLSDNCNSLDNAATQSLACGLACFRHLRWLKLSRNDFDVSELQFLTETTWHNL